MYTCVCVRKRKCVGVRHSLDDSVCVCVCVCVWVGGGTHLMTVGTQPMLGSAAVNGEATLASASDSEMPACAVLSAPQSLAPSPHMPT